MKDAMIGAGVAVVVCLVLTATGCGGNGVTEENAFVPFVPAELARDEGGVICELPELMKERRFRVGLALCFMGYREEFQWTPEAVLVRASLAKDLELRANLTAKA